VAKNPQPRQRTETADMSSADLADAEVLVDRALHGRSLSRSQARKVATSLRATVQAAGPLSGPDKALATRLRAAADVLDPKPVSEAKPAE
jgi:hypothetical protein